MADTPLLLDNSGQLAAAIAEHNAATPQARAMDTWEALPVEARRSLLDSVRSFTIEARELGPDEH